MAWIEAHFLFLSGVPNSGNWNNWNGVRSLLFSLTCNFLVHNSRCLSWTIWVMLNAGMGLKTDLWLTWVKDQRWIYIYSSTYTPWLLKHLASAKTQSLSLILFSNLTFCFSVNTGMSEKFLLHTTWWSLKSTEKYITPWVHLFGWCSLLQRWSQNSAEMNVFRR